MAKKDNIFEEASRRNLMFRTPQGTMNVSDLWNLPLTSKTGAANLDDIARTFNRELKSQAEESFVTKPAKKDATLELCFNIVKHIIDVRLAENEAARDLEDRRKRKQKIADIIAQKQDQALTEKSLEELEAELAGL